MSEEKQQLLINKVRRSYQVFFALHGHAVIPSAPLLPENDPTTLFTSSGMQPLVPYLLGQKHPAGSRLVNSQKCFRANDIEEVGDNRHTTFFEMLGNWSLGDYFKKEQLTWCFTFLTQELKLDVKRLYVTVFGGNKELGVEVDNESVEIWQKLFFSVGIEAKVVIDAAKNGMGDGKIFFYPEKKNWWSRSGIPADMPVGEPGGPDSEVFYDFGEELNLHQNSPFADEPCHVNCDCGRFMEIGNSVFMQYIKNSRGGFDKLPKQNVDFGGGLERIVAAIENKVDIFETSTFAQLLDLMKKTAQVPYQAEHRRAYRVVMDHLRAAVMIIAAGVLPSSKEQGYFVRRLLRRALRFADQIGISGENFLKLVEPIISAYAPVYPEVAQDSLIFSAIKDEQTKFSKALHKGMAMLDREKKINEEIAFKLYETYGFPFELTQEIAKERGFSLDMSKFKQQAEKHSLSSRTASAGKFKGGLADHSAEVIKFHTATHLLHAALRKYLGEGVRQKGSNITADRLRFDFSFDRGVKPEELSMVERQINDWIKLGLPVTRQIMAKEVALNSGAIAFFSEKYAEQVSVYTIGNDVEKDWVSKEFCGGPHVENTAVIGQIKISKEQSAGQGVRRIYIQFA